MSEPRIQDVAAGIVNADGAAHGWLANSVRIGFLAAITRNGAGDYTLTLDGQAATDAAEGIVHVTPREAGVASGAVATHAVWVNDTTIRVTTLQEQAAGAASILADVDFNVTVKRLVRR